MLEHRPSANSDGMKRLFLGEARQAGEGSNTAAGAVHWLRPIASIVLWAAALSVSGVLCVARLEAQSISITNPVSGTPTISGSSNTFTVNLSSAPNVVEVCYTLDVYPVYDPGINASSALGCSAAQPFSIPYNSYWYGNGAHTLTATAYDANGLVVAASSPVPFTIANTWPNPNNLAMTVSYGTPTSSPWSGAVAVTPTFTGTGAGTDNLTYTLYVNGIEQGQTAGVFSSTTLYAQTTNFPNGPADICVEVTDNTSGTPYTGNVTFIGGVYESCVQATLNNGTTATDIAQTNAHDIYLTPGGPFGGNCDVAPIGSGSCTLTAKILNTDGSLTGGTPLFCAGSYPSGGGPPNVQCGTSQPIGGAGIPFTVSSAGVITANPGGLGTGVVVAMVPSVSGSDLVTGSVAPSFVNSTSHPFSTNETGEAIAVTAGTGWTQSMWIIQSAAPSGASLYCGQQNLCPGAKGLTGGSFSLGPTRIDNVFVAPSNTTPCFAPNGTVHTSYDPSCYVMHTIWDNAPDSIYAVAAEQPYYPGAAADFSASGLNTYEVGAIFPGGNITGAETPGGFTAWDSALANHISSYESICATIVNCHFFLLGNGIADEQGSLYGATYGAAASWSTPPFQDVVSRWSAYGNVTAMNYGDEYPWGDNPLQGPISFSSGSGQSWLKSITASGGTCSVAVGPGSAGSGGVGGYSFTAAASFIIHGSAVPGMNSVAPSVYGIAATPGGGATASAVASGSTVTVTMMPFGGGAGYSASNPPNVYLIGGGGTYTSATPTISAGAITGITVTGASGYTSNPSVWILPNFTFACSAVPNGTYNSTNDPGLVLEAITAAWVQNASGTYEYTPYDIYTKYWAQANQVSPRLALGAAPVGVTINAGASAFAYWFGNILNTNQSIGSTTQVADFADLYPENGSLGYLISRYAADSLPGVGNIGQTIRSTYGLGYDPSKPLVTLTPTDDGNYWGFQGDQGHAVASCSSHLITFSQPHGIQNIIPGMTRLQISGATDSGSPQDSCNNKFIVWDAPTPTTLDVTLATTDSTGSNVTGTMYMQDGSTYSGSSTFTINASGQVQGGCGIGTFNPWGGILCGDILYVGASATPSILTKRGQTFSFMGTATGTGAAYFNANTFLLSPENVSQPGTVSGAYKLSFRQIPVLNATGGTATIFTDDNFVKGPRNASPEVGGSKNPGWAFGASIECIFLRCAGEREYQYFGSANGYDSSKLGFTSPYAGAWMKLFGDTVVEWQLGANVHFENTGVVPTFHGKSSAALYWNRYAKYWFQPRLNAPDYGPYIECAAASGSPGNIMACMNVSDGPQTVTFKLSPYLVAGQQIIQQVVNDHSIGADTMLAAGTTSSSATLKPYDVITFVMPNSFSTELLQPAISVRLADVANATDIVIRWTYDRYYLDVAGDTFDCGTGNCTPGWDKNIGTIYYRVLYRNSAGEVIATSDVQQL